MGTLATRLSEIATSITRYHAMMVPVSLGVYACQHSPYPRPEGVQKVRKGSKITEVGAHSGLRGGGGLLVEEVGAHGFPRSAKDVGEGPPDGGACLG